MARTRNEQKFNQTREGLLEVGQELFITSSFNSVGLNDILKKSGIPKGSFYHYFESKEDFGLQVIEFYSRRSVEELEAILADDSKSPYQQLKEYFASNINHFDSIDYCQGCLMANLSQELADVNEKLRCKINELSQQMVNRIAEVIEEMDGNEIGLRSMPSGDASKLIMNSWQGALMKMKLEKSREPLDVFMRFFFVT